MNWDYRTYGMQSNGPSFMLWESQKEERETRAKWLFEEIMVENVLDLIKDMKINIQETQWNPSRMNSKRPTPRDVIIKLSKDKESWELASAAHILKQEQCGRYYHGPCVRMRESWQQQGERNHHLQGINSCRKKWWWRTQFPHHPTRSVIGQLCTNQNSSGRPLRSI